MARKIAAFFRWRSPLCVLRTQKSKRNASCPVRLPPLSAVCADCKIPKVLGLPKFVAGGAKLVWFRTLVNVASNRNRRFSRSYMFFDSPASTALVPGPSKMATPALPIRAAPIGVGAKALILNSCPVAKPSCFECCHLPGSSTSR